MLFWDRKGSNKQINLMAFEIANNIAELVSQLNKDDNDKLKTAGSYAFNCISEANLINDLEEIELLNICDNIIKVLGLGVKCEKLDERTDYTMIILNSHFECFEKIGAGQIAFTGGDDDKTYWTCYKYLSYTEVIINANGKCEFEKAEWTYLDNPFEDEDEE